MQIDGAIAFMQRDMPGENAGLEDLRRWVDGLGAGSIAPETVEREDIVIGGIAAAHFHAPGNMAAHAVLYLHGGAYMAGSATSHGALAALLAAATDMDVLLPLYRLAPEHPFPAALDDAIAVYLDLVAAGRQVSLAGDSAGGGLALSLALAIRDRGEIMPASLSLISPWTDMTLSGASMTERAAIDPMVTEDALRAAIASYATDRPPADPGLSPLFADLEGLPPMLIQVGERERLRDDAARLAEKARAAGCEADYREWPGMIHVWHLFGRHLPESGRAIAELSTHIRYCLRPPAS
ncbi:alpha/beta hydrolase [Sphingomonas colocasiae]|uniref:Alpha/beta hydrolase n=1 Tax=Sphingomonas colocasiae TaxID=1848973 RepID=A0ABS7PK67_9SPHN|nr:alpha/beta hydrolase [Sphingomonas colocasiae]MBY8821681.1 alpha/beta hydrolase [Sphingomonas colocasiae]